MSRATPLLLKCHHGSLTHGTARRLLLACLPLQVDDLRAIGMLYADEVETVDTSYAKSKHKLLTIQLSYANLPVDLRFDHGVIQLLGVARHPAVTRWGQAGVFAGVDKDGKRIADGAVVSDDFLEGAQGRWFSVTNTDGSVRRWRLKLYIGVVCGDYPQVQAMGPWMESAGAYCPCRGCNYWQDYTLKHETPHSFLKGGQWTLRNKRWVSAQVCAVSRAATCGA